ncbi:MAG: PAS domain S-box protein [Candidatus Thorarchaeota archaeon]|nr:PAS domain S-box protein [Candidatus Thorarchaeota archaeon]
MLRIRAGLRAAIDQFFSLTALTPERKRAMHELLAAAFILFAAATLVSVCVLYFVTPPLISEADFTRLSAISIIAMVGFTVSVFLNRHGMRRMGPALFLLVVILVVLLGDNPEEVATGRSLIYFVIPIMTAGILISPRAAFGGAAASGLAVSAAGLQAGLFPSIPAITAYFALAVIMWGWGKSLEDALVALGEREQWYRFLTESARDAIIATSMDLKTTYVSPAVKSLFGYDPEEVTGRAVTDFVTPESAELLAKELAATLSADTSGTYYQHEWAPLDLDAVRRDGSIAHVEVSREVMRDNEGKAVGFLAVARDVSERMAAKKQLERAYSLASFYNNILAHDLSAMLQSTVMGIELTLTSSALPKHYRGHLEDALAQAQACASLVQNVRKHSRLIEERPQLVRTDPSVALTSAIERVKRSYPGRDIDIRVSMKSQNLSVMADEFLEELLFNLLHNSVKADTHSSVVIDVAVSRTEHGQALITVDDHGSGMDDEMKKSVMSVESTGSTQHGLGLRLVSQIVQRYGGTFSFADRVAGDHTQGTRAIVQIPLAPQKEVS